MKRDDPVIGVAPRITRARFIQVLHEHNSPAASSGGAGYDRVLARGVDPLFALAIFWSENNLATNPASVEARQNTRNPGMRRSTRNGLGRDITDPNRDGVYQKYKSWADGWDDLAFSLVDDTFVYVKERRNTPATIIPRWAPTGDQNNPDAYIIRAMEFMNRYYMDINARVLQGLRDRGLEAHDIRHRLVTGTRNYVRQSLSSWSRVAVHHTAGGLGVTSLDRDIARWVGHSGFHVHSRGWPGIAYALGFNQSGRVFLLRSVLDRGFHASEANIDSVGIALDIGLAHQPTDAALNSMEHALAVLIELFPNLAQVRVFGHGEVQAVTTSCPGNLLSWVRDVRAGRVALPGSQRVPDKDHAYVEATDKWVVGNIYKRWSEQDLMIFGLPISGMTGNEVEGYHQAFERQILHHLPGSWPDRHDVFLERVGVEVADRLGLPGKFPGEFGRREFLDNDEVRYFDQTGHTIWGRFKHYWEYRGGLDLFGYPISEAYVDPDTGRRVQYFERARFEHHPNTLPDRGDILLGLLGLEVLRLREEQDRTVLTYIVQEGDTLSKIAVEHSVSLDALVAANPGITDVNRIFPGDILTIPTGV